MKIQIDHRVNDKVSSVNRKSGRIKIEKILSVMVFVFSGSALADTYACDLDHMLSMEQIQQKLIMQGYKTIRELQLDDCMYEANVRDKKMTGGMSRLIQEPVVL